MSEAVAIIKVVGKDEASRELKKVQTSLQDIEKSAKNLNSKSGGLSELLGGSRIAKFATFAGAAAGIAYVAKESIVAASNLEGLERRASVIFGDSFPKMSAEAEKLATAMNRSAGDILGYQTTIATLGQSLRIPGAEVEKMSQDISRLAVDFGKFYTTLSDDQALEALRTGLLGQTKQLAALGVVMRDDTLEAYALARGWKVQVGELNEAQQMMLRYNFLMDNTKKIQEGAARATGSVNDEWKEMKARVHDVFEELGKPALPATAFGLEVINNFLTGTTFILGTLGEQVRGVFSDMSALVIKAAQLTGFENVGIKSYTKTSLLGGRNATDLSDAELKRMGAAANEAGKGAKKGDEEWKRFMGTLGGGTKKAGKDAEDELKKVQDGVNDLVGEYWAARAEVDRSLSEMSNSHKEKMADIRKEIDDTKKAMADLEKDFGRNTAGIDQSQADILNDQKEKVADLEKSLKELNRQRESQVNQGLGVEMSLTADIEDETAKLAKEREALARMQEKASSGVTGLAETRGAMSDSERRFSDLEQRRGELKEDHDLRLKQLQEEQDKLNQKSRDEQASYQRQRSEMAETKTALIDFHETWVANLTDVSKVTTETLEIVKTSLEDLKKKVSEFDALMKSRPQVTGGGTATEKAKARASGGLVTESHTLAGESGAELLELPYGTKVRTAEESRKMGGGVSIQIGEVHVHNEADEDRFIEKIARMIQLRSLQAA